MGIGLLEYETLTEYTKRWGETGAGEEEAYRRSTGGQEVEVRILLEPAGTGPQIKAGRGDTCIRWSPPSNLVGC